MATADEIYSQLSESIPEHTHRVTDSDTYFIINPVTRQISNTTNSKNTLMQYDHDSERFTFEVSRYIEGHDMMLCNSVKIHYNNISSGYGENVGVYDVEDLRVDPKNSNAVLCSWLISRNATQFDGILSFIVHYACTDNDGNVVYEWYSDIYSDIEIKAGRNNGEAAVIEYTDILEQWRAKLFGVEDSVTANIVSASETQQTEIEAKGAETLASIPEDYTTVANMADEALRRKSDAILVNETGEYIYLDDSSDCNLVGLNIYGKTRQIQTTGKNLLDPSLMVNGVYDGTQLNQYADGVYMSFSMSIEPGTYTVSFSNPVNIIRYGIDSVSNVSDKMNIKSYTFTVETVGTLYLSFRNTISTSTPWYPWYTVQLESGDVATDYEPYSGGYSSPSSNCPQSLESVIDPTIRIYGKNLISNKEREFTYAGVTFTTHADGSITINGTATNPTSYLFDNNGIIPVKNKKLIASLGSTDSDIFMAIGYHRADGTHRDTLEKICNVEYEFFYPDEATATRTYLHIATAKTYNNVRVWPMIRMADANSDTSNSKKETQTISQTRTLRGIPVDSGGNYTDENGQQWICDEIDFERGKYIQRVVALTLDGSQSFGINNYQLTYANSYAFETYVAAITGAVTEIPVMSDMLPRRLWSAYVGDKDGIYATAGRILISFGDQEIKTVEDLTAYLQSNPIEVIYERDSVLETDLTSAEMEAFRALHTNATNTTILNDQNASVVVKYVADVKRYIYKNCNVKRKFDLNIFESKWVGHDNDTYYSQVVDVTVGKDVKIDLHPTAEQLIDLLQDGISMFVANENGVVTVYSVGGSPGTITIQATETVVYYE